MTALLHALYLHILMSCHQTFLSFFSHFLFPPSAGESAESVLAMIGWLILCLACDLCCSSDVHNKLPQGISMIMQWQHSAGITTHLTTVHLCVCCYCSKILFNYSPECLSFLENHCPAHFNSCPGDLVNWFRTPPECVNIAVSNNDY